MAAAWFGNNQPQINRSPRRNGRYSPGKETLVDLRAVSKAYRTAAGDFYALQEVDLQVGAGEFVAVVGKSGSGKSTLLNMITGIDRPTRGEVWVNGTPIYKLNENRMAAWRGRNLGIVFQFFQLLPTLTTIENIMLPMDFCNRYPFWKRKAIAMELLRLVELEDQANKLPAALSGGQQQRVAIARALANNPPVLVADEPTGNLDSQTAQSVFGLFQALAAQGKTVLMVTHDQELARAVPRSVYLRDGWVVFDSTSPYQPGIPEPQVEALPTDAVMRASAERASPYSLILTSPKGVPPFAPNGGNGDAAPQAPAHVPPFDSLSSQAVQEPESAASVEDSLSAQDRLPSAEAPSRPDQAQPEKPGGDKAGQAQRANGRKKSPKTDLSQPGVNTVSNPEGTSAEYWRQARLSAILADPGTAAEKLRHEFELVAHDRTLMQSTYEAVLAEVSQAAQAAEQAGHFEEARSLWAVLVEATAPWAGDKPLSS